MNLSSSDKILIRAALEDKIRELEKIIGNLQVEGETYLHGLLRQYQELLNRLF